MRLHYRAPPLDGLLQFLELPPILVQFFLFHHDVMVQHFRVHLHTCLSDLWYILKAVSGIWAEK